MDQRQEIRAFDVLNTFSEQQLHKLFEQYGGNECKNFSQTVTETRRTIPFRTIINFKQAVSSVVKEIPTSILLRYSRLYALK
jgi:16S rRNA (cytosine1402-N4)-methyltransferase